MTETVREHGAAQGVVRHVDIAVCDMSHHEACLYFLHLFWSTTSERPTAVQPLCRRSGKTHKVETLLQQQGRARVKFSAVRLEDVDELPLPTMASEVYAQPLQVDGNADDVEVVEHAYDDRQDELEEQESVEHTPLPRALRAPPEPLPRDPLDQSPYDDDAPGEMDQRAFVDIGLREESLQYHGAPWMIHDGFNVQMAVIHLAPHEQLGMEQHVAGVQVIYVLDGNLVVHAREPDPENLDEFMDVFYRCGAGQMVVIPRGAAHNVLNQADDLHARAWQFYIPRVHPGERGVYAEKYHDDDAPSDFQLQSSLTPEARGANEPVQLFDALLHAAHSHTDTVIHETADVVLSSHVVRGDTGSVFSREGYYYVVAGLGEVFNHDTRLGRTGSVSRSKSREQRPTPLVPGSVFYVLPDSFAAVAANDINTSLHILAVTSPTAALLEESFDMSDSALEDEKTSPYVAPELFVSEVLNAAPIASGDIQEIDLRNVLQRAMDARRGFIKQPHSDDEQDGSATDGEYDEWSD